MRMNTRSNWIASKYISVCKLSCSLSGYEFSLYASRTFKMICKLRNFLTPIATNLRQCYCIWTIKYQFTGFKAENLRLEILPATQSRSRIRNKGMLVMASHDQPTWGVFSSDFCEVDSKFHIAKRSLHLIESRTSRSHRWAWLAWTPDGVKV